MSLSTEFSSSVTRIGTSSSPKSLLSHLHVSCLTILLLFFEIWDSNALLCLQELTLIFFLRLGKNWGLGGQSEGINSRTLNYGIYNFSFHFG